MMRPLFAILPAFALLTLASCRTTVDSGLGGAGGIGAGGSAPASVPACGTVEPSDCTPMCGPYGTILGQDDTPTGCPAGNFALTCVTDHGDLGARCYPTRINGEACCMSWQCASGYCDAPAGPWTPGVCAR